MAKAAALTVGLTRKRCGRCRKVKSIEHFSRNRTKRDGFQWYCKSCKAVEQDLRLYGITVENYNRLFSQQKGKCALCRRTPSHQLHIDHDHRTGEVRGLLCKTCNLTLGYYEKYQDEIHVYLRSSR